ncbi:MAG: lipopolysaccharide export system permease protein, partial [Chthoniobacter sp.]|nr:lipopolysaccharide export system permease protein [Chthoniobacter sp.]
MKLLDRYVGKEILLTATFAIAVLSLVLVLGNVFKQLLDLLVN